MQRRSMMGAIASLAFVGLIAGCAATGQESVPGASSGAAATPNVSVTELCEDPTVLSCAPHPQSVVVTVTAEAADDAIADLAERLHAAAAAEGLEMGADLRRDAVPGLVQTSEYSAPPAWNLSVYPGDIVDVRPTIEQMLAIEDVLGTVNIAVVDGWPSVSVTSVDLLGAVFDAASATDLFADGGSYSVLSFEQETRLEHAPDWFSDAGMHEVIAVATEHLDAEVLLEAPRGGVSAPTLYVSRLTPEQVAALDARLSGPELADTSTVQIEYVLGTIGADGVTYTYGYLGVE